MIFTHVLTNSFFTTTYHSFLIIKPFNLLYNILTNITTIILSLALLSLLATLIIKPIYIFQMTLYYPIILLSNLIFFLLSITFCLDQIPLILLLFYLTCFLIATLYHKHLHQHNLYVIFI